MRGKHQRFFFVFFEADGFPFVSFHMLSIAAKKFEKRGKNEKKNLPHSADSPFFFFLLREGGTRERKGNKPERKQK